jgi:hypothetical protein
VVDADNLVLLGLACLNSKSSHSLLVSQIIVLSIIEYGILQSPVVFVELCISPFNLSYMLHVFEGSYWLHICL